MKHGACEDVIRLFSKDLGISELHISAQLEAPHCRLQDFAPAGKCAVPLDAAVKRVNFPLMAAKPKEREALEENRKAPVPGPVGDGFPKEKDVSTPPPGSDQAAKDKKRK